MGRNNLAIVSLGIAAGLSSKEVGNIARLFADQPKPLRRNKSDRKRNKADRWK